MSKSATTTPSASYNGGDKDKKNVKKVVAPNGILRNLCSHVRFLWYLNFISEEIQV